MENDSFGKQMSQPTKYKECFVTPSGKVFACLNSSSGRIFSKASLQQCLPKSARDPPQPAIGQTESSCSIPSVILMKEHIQKTKAEKEKKQHLSALKSNSMQELSLNSSDSKQARKKSPKNTGKLPPVPFPKEKKHKDGKSHCLRLVEAHLLALRNTLRGGKPSTSCSSYSEFLASINLEKRTISQSTRMGSGDNKTTLLAYSAVTEADQPLEIDTCEAERRKRRQLKEDERNKKKRESDCKKAIKKKLKEQKNLDMAERKRRQAQRKNEAAMMKKKSKDADFCQTLEKYLPRKSNRSTPSEGSTLTARKSRSSDECAARQGRSTRDHTCRKSHSSENQLKKKQTFEDDRCQRKHADDDREKKKQSSEDDRCQKKHVFDDDSYQKKQSSDEDRCQKKHVFEDERDKKKHSSDEDRCQRKHAYDDDRYQKKHASEDDKKKHTFDDDRCQRKHAYDDEREKKKHSFDDDRCQRKHAYDDERDKKKQTFDDDRCQRKHAYDDERDKKKQTFDEDRCQRKHAYEDDRCQKKHAYEDDRCQKKHTFDDDHCQKKHNSEEDRYQRKHRYDEDSKYCRCGEDYSSRKYHYEEETTPRKTQYEDDTRKQRYTPDDNFPRNDEEHDSRKTNNAPREKYYRNEQMPPSSEERPTTVQYGKSGESFMILRKIQDEQMRKMKNSGNRQVEHCKLKSVVKNLGRLKINIPFAGEFCDGKHSKCQNSQKQDKGGRQRENEDLVYRWEGTPTNFMDEDCYSDEDEYVYKSHSGSAPDHHSRHDQNHHEMQYCMHQDGKASHHKNCRCVQVYLQSAVERGWSGLGPFQKVTSDSGTEATTSKTPESSKSNKSNFILQNAKMPVYQVCHNVSSTKMERKKIKECKKHCKQQCKQQHSGRDKKQRKDRSRRKGHKKRRKCKCKNCWNKEDECCKCKKCGNVHRKGTSEDPVKQDAPKRERTPEVRYGKRRKSDSSPLLSFLTNLYKPKTRDPNRSRSMLKKLDEVRYLRMCPLSRRKRSCLKQSDTSCMKVGGPCNCGPKLCELECRLSGLQKPKKKKRNRCTDCNCDSNPTEEDEKKKRKQKKKKEKKKRKCVVKCGSEEVCVCRPKDSDDLKSKKKSKGKKGKETDTAAYYQTIHCPSGLGTHNSTSNTSKSSTADEKESTTSEKSKEQDPEKDQTTKEGLSSLHSFWRNLRKISNGRNGMETLIKKIRRKKSTCLLEPEISMVDDCSNIGPMARIRQMEEQILCEKSKQKSQEQTDGKTSCRRRHE